MNYLLACVRGYSEAFDCRQDGRSDRKPPPAINSIAEDRDRVRREATSQQQVANPRDLVSWTLQLHRRAQVQILLFVNEKRAGFSDDSRGHQLQGKRQTRCLAGAEKNRQLDVCRDEWRKPVRNYLHQLSCIGLFLISGAAHGTLDLKNGNYTERFFDMETSNSKSPKDSLMLDRTYNSISTKTGVWGPRWCSSLDSTLRHNAFGQLEFQHCGAGHVVVFNASNPAGLTAKPALEDASAWVASRLTADSRSVLSEPAQRQVAKDRVSRVLKIEQASDTELWKVLRTRVGLNMACEPGSTFASLQPSYSLKCGVDGIEVFEAGQLYAVFDTRFQLKEVLNGLGGRMVLERDADGRLVRLLCNDGVVIDVSMNVARQITALRRQATDIFVEYTYTDGHLSKVRNQWKNTYGFVYTESRLTKIIFPDSTYKALSYIPSTGLVSTFRDRQFEGAVCVEDYSYEQIRPGVFRSNALKRCGGAVGKILSTEFTTAAGKLVRVRTETPGGLETTVDYDALGLVSRRRVRSVSSNVDALTEYRFDSRGRLAKRTAPEWAESFDYAGEAWVPQKASRTFFDKQPMHVRTFTAGASGQVVLSESNSGRYEILERRGLDIWRVKLPDGGILLAERRNNGEGDSAIRSIEIEGVGKIVELPGSSSGVCQERAANVSPIDQNLAAQLCDRYRTMTEEVEPFYALYREVKNPPSKPSGTNLEGILREMVVARNAGDFSAVRDLTHRAQDPVGELGRQVFDAVVDQSISAAREAAGKGLIDSTNDLYREGLLRKDQLGAGRYAALAAEYADWMYTQRRHVDVLAVLQTVDVESARRVSLTAERDWVTRQTRALWTLGRTSEAFSVLSRCLQSESCAQEFSPTVMSNLVTLAADADRPVETDWLLEGMRIRTEIERFVLADEMLGNANFMRLMTALVTLGREEEAFTLLGDEMASWSVGSASSLQRIQVALERASVSQRMGRFASTSEALKTAGMFCKSAPEEPVCSRDLADAAKSFERAIGDISAPAAVCESDLPATATVDELLDRALLCQGAKYAGLQGRLSVSLEDSVRRGAVMPVHSANYYLAWAGKFSATVPRRLELLREATRELDTALGASNWRAVRAHVWLAEAMLEGGQISAARDQAVAAIPAAARTSDPRLLVSLYQLIADCAEESGSHDQAIFWGKRAINSFQAIRGKSVGLDAQLDRKLLKNNRAPYERLAGWLVSAGRLAEAEQVLAMLKERELQELGPRAGVSDAPPSLALTGAEIAHERDLQVRQLIGVSQAVELEALNQRRRVGESLNEQQLARASQLQMAQTQWRLDLQRFMANLQTGISVDSAAAQAIRASFEQSVGKLRSVVRSASERSGLRHVALSYLVTATDVAIIIVTSEGSFARQSRVPRAELNARIHEFRRVLQRPELDPRPAGQALHDLLLAPIEANLLALDPQTIVLNLTDTLRYIPFAALYDGRKYMAQRYSLALYTSAGGATIEPQDTTGWRVAGFGLTRAARVGETGFNALPAVADELAGIVRTSANPRGVMSGDSSLNEQFNGTSFRRALDLADRNRTPVLHVASHFHLVPGSDYGSYLVLGDSTALRLSELREMNFSAIQMLTLSACNTATQGGLNENGSEVEGLAAAAQLAGANTVLATLWPVADASTALLMQRFYQIRTATSTPSSRMSHAVALRRAQLELIDGDNSVRAGPSESSERKALRVDIVPDAQLKQVPFVNSETAPFAHPYFWAPFVLQGNWL